MILLAMLFALSWQAQSQVIAMSGQDQAQSDKSAIQALQPRDFRELPTAIVGSLEARKCSIPQDPFVKPKTPHNVIRGSFTGAGRNEWAVLCLSGGTSSILVFQADPAKLVAEVAAEKADRYLAKDEQGKPYHNRIIEPVDKDYILSHYKGNGPKPPPITHQGINDGRLESGSVVRYFHNGKWLELQGRD
jgi:hypothetical protein